MNLADSAHLALTNLTYVPVLAFVLGVVSTSLLRSPLRLPDSVYRFLSFYLLLAIGVKGGVALSTARIGDVVWPAIAALALGIVIPIGAFFALKLVTRLGVTDRGALAAHYGSTSLVTFTAATALLAASSIPVEGFAPTLLAIMEVPGIVVGLAIVGLARRTKAQAQNAEQRVLVGVGGRETIDGAPPATRDEDTCSIDDDTPTTSWSATMREVLTAPSVVLLVGGLVIGLITGPAGFDKVDPLFNGLFQGLLALFLLHMGAVAGETLSSVRRAGAGLVGFALVFPLVAGSIGVFAGTAVGLSVGGAAILGVLCASASYIAAPAAVSLALPGADRGLCLAASLGMTFPFNLLLGIPLLVALASVVGTR